MTVYTDHGSANASLPLDHDTVRRAVSTCIQSNVRTKCTESLWSLKSAQKSTGGMLSPMHLHCYRQERTGRRWMLVSDTTEQMSAIIRALHESDFGNAT